LGWNIHGVCLRDPIRRLWFVDLEDDCNVSSKPKCLPSSSVGVCVRVLNVRVFVWAYYKLPIKGYIADQRRPHTYVTKSGTCCGTIATSWMTLRTSQQNADRLGHSAHRGSRSKNTANMEVLQIVARVMRDTCHARHLRCCCDLPMT
jgi:hypothetical protein